MTDTVKRTIEEIADPDLQAALMTFARACLDIDLANYPLTSHESDGSSHAKPGSRLHRIRPANDGVRRVMKLAEQARSKADEVTDRAMRVKPQQVHSVGGVAIREPEEVVVVTGNGRNTPRARRHFRGPDGRLMPGATSSHLESKLREAAGEESG